MHIGQPAIDSVLAKGQALVVDSQEMQNGGMKIVAVAIPFGSLIAPVVTLLISRVGLNSRASDPRHRVLGAIRFLRFCRLSRFMIS